MADAAGDPIGRRIARARKLRGLTQTGLAAKVPCSKSLIAQVEGGHKPATPSLVAAAARALNVEVTELTGQPYRGGDANSDRVHAPIPQIREALAYWDLAPVLDVPARPLGELSTMTQRVNQLRNRASYVELGPLLPALIKELVVHAHGKGGRDRARAFRLLVDAYTAVDSMAYALGYLDLLALAVERSGWAAAQADDPLLRYVATIRRSQIFLATGTWDGGLALLDRARMDLESEVSDEPGPLSVFGTVQLRAAIMAARGNRAGPAWDSMDQARQVAGRIGRDTKDYRLLFGPSNVGIHQVAVAVELGDADEAVRRSAGLQLPEDLPHERSSHHFIDLSRAWLWQGKTDKALACVWRAEQLAPQRTRYHPMARETVARLLDIQRRVPEQLHALAARMNLS